MLSGFDHVVVAVNDLDDSVPAYEVLLGRAPLAIRRHSGYEAALFQTANIGVELMAPRGDDDMARRLRTTLAQGEGLKSLVFATDDIERAHRRAQRVGLAPEPIQAAANDDGARVFRLTKTNGLRLFVMERPSGSRREGGDGAVRGLDHIVVRTPRIEDSLGLFSARLGLSLRLETHVANRRLMMLRCGDAILEIAEYGDRDSDALWGVSWRVTDAVAEQARLAGAGCNVSEVRAGVKPDTRVFTVRDRTCGVPTLMIELGVKAS